MLIRTIRPYSEQERKQLIARLPSRWSRVESFIGWLAFLVGVAMIPLLLIDKYFPISPSNQLVAILLIIILAAGILLHASRHYEGSFNRKRILAAIDAGQAEVLHVKTTRAVERADPEDFGVAFYLEVEVDGMPRLLYLQGQYLDDLAWEETFPNTDFDLIRQADTHEVFDVRLKGHYLKPESTLLAFTKARWQAGDVPEDGDILISKLDDLT